MKPVLLILLIMLSSQIVFTQDHSSMIKGSISDSSSSDPLVGASISLLNSSNKQLIRQASSSPTGFAFRRIAPGTYLLYTSFTGYRPDTTIFTIANDGILYLSIRLAPLAADLMEVVVRSTVPPVIIRNDTIRFNTSIVATEPNATIEDLLRKLPGFQVDREGVITLRGKRVEKIYIDGKEFFLNDPKAATRNLDADIIDAIEAFDNQSDRARFTGIRDLNTGTAINLRLKKDRKKGIYGNSTLQAGNRHSITGNAVANAFKGDRWAFLSLSGNRQANDNQYKQSVFTGALNFRDQLFSKVKLVLNYQGSHSDQLNRELYRRQTFFGDSSILQTRPATRINELMSHTLAITNSYELDSSTSIMVVPSLSLQQSRNSTLDSSIITSIADSTFNIHSKGTTINDIQAQSQNFTNGITFQKRLKKKGRTFYAALNVNKLSSRQEGNLFSQLALYDTSGTSSGNRLINQHFLQSSQNHNTSLNLIYTEPINAKQVLDIGYTISYERNRSSKNAFDFNPLTGHYDIKDTLTTNSFTYKNTQQTYSLGYNFIGTKLQYQLGVNFLFNSMSNFSLDDKFPSTRGRFHNWSPRSSLFYQFTPQRYLQLQYQGNSISPTTEMLQPIPDLSNPYLVKLGNPYLKQQFDHNLTMQYNAANSKTLSNGFFQLSGRLTQDKIVPAAFLSSNGLQTLQYLNVNGIYSADGSFNYNFAINKAKNGTAGFTCSVQYNTDVNRVNNLPTTMHTFSASQQFTINYQLKEQFIANISATARLNRSDISPGEMQNSTWISQNYWCFLSWSPLKHLRINSDINAVFHGRQGELPSNKLITWNMAAYCLIFHQKQGEIRVSVFDLLKGNRQIIQTMGANFFEFRQASVIQQYFAVSFRYNFKVR